MKRRPQRRSAGGPFWPLLLLLAAALAWFGWQAVLLQQHRAALQAARAAQQAPLEQAARSRAAIDALAAGTQRLADGGNVHALLVVDALKRRGVTIDALTPALPPPGR